MRAYTVKMIWDDGYWHTRTEADLGITLSSDSFDILVERVRKAAPEMLALNCGFFDEFELNFETIRKDVVRQSA